MVSVKPEDHKSILEWWAVTALRSVLLTSAKNPDYLKSIGILAITQTLSNKIGMRKIMLMSLLLQLLLLLSGCDGEITTDAVIKAGYDHAEHSFFCKESNTNSEDTLPENNERATDLNIKKAGTLIQYQDIAEDLSFEPATGRITTYTGEEAYIQITAQLKGVAVKRIGNKAFGDA